MNLVATLHPPNPQCPLVCNRVALTDDCCLSVRPMSPVKWTALEVAGTMDSDKMQGAKIAGRVVAQQRPLTARGRLQHVNANERIGEGDAVGADAAAPMATQAAAPASSVYPLRELRFKSFDSAVITKSQLRPQSAHVGGLTRMKEKALHGVVPPREHIGAFITQGQNIDSHLSEVSRQTCFWL